MIKAIDMIQFDKLLEYRKERKSSFVYDIVSYILILTLWYQFYNNDVVNPLDAYILMETVNENTKKAEYREYKEWLLSIERMNVRGEE